MEIYSLTGSGTYTALLLQTTNPELKSSLNITTGATVYFVNLTCEHRGAAAYGENANIYTGAKVRVILMYNVVDAHSGAVYVINGVITVGIETYMMFTYTTLQLRMVEQLVSTIWNIDS